MGGCLKHLSFLCQPFETNQLRVSLKKTARPHPRSDPRGNRGNTSRGLASSPSLPASAYIGVMALFGTQLLTRAAKGPKVHDLVFNWQSRMRGWDDPQKTLEHRGDLKFRSFGYCDRLLFIFCTVSRGKAKATSTRLVFGTGGSNRCGTPLQAITSNLEVNNWSLGGIATPRGPSNSPSMATSCKGVLCGGAQFSGWPYPIFTMCVSQDRRTPTTVVSCGIRWILLKPF